MIPGPAFGPAGTRPPLRAVLHPASRVMAALLALVTTFAIPVAWVPAWAAPVSVLLTATGLGPRQQLRAVRAWWTVGLLVLAVHTLTTTAAAPLWHPSWAGLLAGAAALLRVMASAGWLALLMRTTNLDELVGGLRWWTAPLRRLGLADDDLGLVLAVAMGTAPALLGEARRVEAVARLRRHGPGGAARRGPLQWIGDRAAVVVPLLEALGRRAEALTLTLRRRRAVGSPCGRPPGLQLAGLAAWTGALALLVVLRTTGPRW